MILSRVAVNRPVFATMVILALLVLGGFAYRDLGVELFPEIDFPIITITATYPGASPETMETEVVKEIEDAVNPVSGVKHISSTAREGLAFVVVEFELEVDENIAAQDVRDKIAGVQPQLPNGIEDLIVQKFDPTAQPIMSIVIGGDMSIRELTLTAREKVKKRIENIQGVGNVELVGGEEREILVELDLTSLEAQNLSIFEVQEKLAAASLEIPAGNLKRHGQDISIKTLGKITSIRELEDYVIKDNGNTQVRLRDIASIIDTTEELTSYSRLNGERAVGLNVIKQSGANVVEVAHSVKAALEELRQEVPAGTEISVVIDNSVFTEESVNDVIINMIYGGLLAVLVIFLFLADVRPTIISAIAIPTSIVATFTVMGALNFSLNFMTLLALSLAVGLLIDDAIVVIENIYRHFAMKKGPRQAALDGTAEIALAVLATTLTILVVFVPVAFMKGIVGQFFYSFGITVAAAVAFSMFIAFWLTPMLSSRWLTKENVHHEGTRNPIYKITNAWNDFFDRLRVFVERAIGFSLKHRALVLVVSLVTFIGSFFLVPLIGFEFVPAYDQGQFFIQFKAAPGTNLSQTASLASGLERVIGQLPELEDQYLTIGSSNLPVNQGQITVRLKELSERERSSFEIMDALRAEFADYPGLKLVMTSEQSEGGGLPVEISISGEKLERLVALAHAVEDSVRATPGAVEVDNSLGSGKPELQVTLDREKIADLGLNVQQLSLAMRYLVNGVVPFRFRDGDKESDVRLRLRESDRNDLSDLARILIPSSKEIDEKFGHQFPLSYVASFKEASAYSEITRYDRQKTIKVTAVNAAGYFAGDVRDAAFARASLIPTPPGYRIYASGEAEIQAESFGYLMDALFLAIVLIFLVLASQFESITDPFSIMLSLPMSLLGAFLGLLFFGSSISIISLIGIIMLMGLVTKNAILMIDFAKQERARGLNRRDALIQAGGIRFRPIMMTTLSMIFGVFPLALGIGPGAELRAGIARAVIGGLTTSTGLTLIVVPVVYTLLEDITRKLTGKSKVSSIDSGEGNSVDEHRSEDASSDTNDTNG